MVMRFEPSSVSQPSEALVSSRAGLLSGKRPTPPNQPPSITLTTAASVLSEDFCSIFFTSMTETLARPPCWRNSELETCP